MAKDGKTVAPYRAVRHGLGLTERWFLRRLRAIGFVTASRETFDAAVRGGCAENDLEAAESLILLERRGYVACRHGSYFVLTAKGCRMAEKAAHVARLFRDPPVAIPEAFLPKISWVDDD